MQPKLSSNWFSTFNHLARVPTNSKISLNKQASSPLTIKSENLTPVKIEEFDKNITKLKSSNDLISIKSLNLIESVEKNREKGIYHIYPIKIILKE